MQQIFFAKDQRRINEMIIFFTNFLRCSNFFFYYYFLIIQNFYDRKIKSMLPSMKIKNGAEIQDGRQKFLLFKT
jgi:hypothetical protein